jgi:NAD(P)-dependent dehydrogenase (short-subunit alcohol dehydrogenase family)
VAAPTYDFKGKVALVTGAGQGLGRTVATMFAASGGAVAIADRPGHPGPAALADEIRAAGGQAIALDMDVTSEADVTRGVADAIAAFGALDILVNNAALHIPAPATEMTESDWDRVVDVNLKGPWLCTKHAARHMVARGGGGRIISIGSTSSFVGVAGQVNYQSSKTGLLGQVRTLAVELAPSHITVNAVCPTIMRTEMATEVDDEWFASTTAINGPWSLFPGVDMIEPSDVAHAVLFLASDAGRYITGTAIPVDAGFTCK